MANDNPAWGDTRIRGGLQNLGHAIAQNTIKAIPEGPRHRARTGAWHEDAVEDIPRRALERARAAIPAFMDHDHEERPHQGVGNELIAPTTSVFGPGPVRGRNRLGGVLRFYYRQAA